MIQYIDGKQVRNMFVSGANNLKNHKDLVDKLNVFPVPDGDTGTNMSLTISCAIKELNKVFVAEDCGGGIKGNIIDIYMPTLSQCYSWGSRNITIQILG